MTRRRVNLKAILADQDLRRELMVPTIQAVQAREGIETTRDQAERAYYIVNEADKTAFFDLERFKGGKRSEPDRREEMFVRTFDDGIERVRFDVARRDFAAVEGTPLAYRRIGLLAHVFRDAVSLEPGWGKAAQGIATAHDARFVRFHWEILTENVASTREETLEKSWVKFAKGGAFCRFYSSIDLRLDWRDDGRVLKAWAGSLYNNSHWTRILKNTDLAFRPGLTWPLRTQRGFNARAMPAGCFFGHKGPAVLPNNSDESWFLLGILNSCFAEYILQGLTSFGSWEVGAIKRLPIPRLRQEKHQKIGHLAKEIHDIKADWNRGNENNDLFDGPWIIRECTSESPLAERLEVVANVEHRKEVLANQLYDQLNTFVYGAYGLSKAARSSVEQTMGERPGETLWVDMQKKTAAQKRMEHVWRLLSYAVKRVVDADEDGIVPFMAVGGETALVDRVSAELAALFPKQDINRVEVDIANELRRKVKGYRSVKSIREWLEDVFFDYHVSLYKKRPILWHIASSQGRGACAVGALCHYHKFDRDRMAKLRGSYLRDAISLFRREAGLADQEGRTEDRQEWQAKLEEAQSLDQRLQWVQEGQDGHPAPGDCRIRTPWKSEDELPSGWQPDIDDGVAVNILPLQTAGVLRITQVV